MIINSTKKTILYKKPKHDFILNKNLFSDLTLSQSEEFSDVLIQNLKQTQWQRSLADSGHYIKSYENYLLHFKITFILNVCFAGHCIQNFSNKLNDEKCIL